MQFLFTKQISISTLRATGPNSFHLGGPGTNKLRGEQFSLRVHAT